MVPISVYKIKGGTVESGKFYLYKQFYYFWIFCWHFVLNLNGLLLWPNDISLILHVYSGKGLAGRPRVRPRDRSVRCCRPCQSWATMYCSSTECPRRAVRCWSYCCSGCRDWTGTNTWDWLVATLAGWPGNNRYMDGGRLLYHKRYKMYFSAHAGLCIWTSLLIYTCLLKCIG